MKKIKGFTKAFDMNLDIREGSILADAKNLILSEMEELREAHPELLKDIRVFLFKDLLNGTNVVAGMNARVSVKNQFMGAYMAKQGKLHAHKEYDLYIDIMSVLEALKDVLYSDEKVAKIYVKSLLAHELGHIVDIENNSLIWSSILPLDQDMLARFMDSEYGAGMEITATLVGAKFFYPEIAREIYETYFNVYVSLCGSAIRKAKDVRMSHRLRELSAESMTKEIELVKEAVRNMVTAKTLMKQFLTGKDGFAPYGSTNFARVEYATALANEICNDMMEEMLPEYL